MKKLTNKILLITLALLIVVSVVICTVNIRKAFHEGEIMSKEEMKEMMNNNSEVEIPEIIVNDDTIQVVDAQMEKEE